MSAGEMYVRVQPGANGLEMGNRVANAAMMMPFAVCRLPFAVCRWRGVSLLMRV
jgi:hypothetical protein